MRLEKKICSYLSSSTETWVFPSFMCSLETFNLMMKKISRNLEELAQNTEIWLVQSGFVRIMVGNLIQRPVNIVAAFSSVVRRRAFVVAVRQEDKEFLLKRVLSSGN